MKIGLVKISELFLLLLLPLAFSGKIHKTISRLLIFFSGMMVISLVKTFFLDFEYLGNSFLKQPFLITIARFVEIITCLVLCNFVYVHFSSLENKKKFNQYISDFIDINLVITILFAFIYILVLFNILSINDTRLVYNYDIRLRGFFVEGGPYGLMLSFLFILTSFLEKTKKRLYKRVFLLFVIYFMAQSKAGILCSVLWLGIENFQFLRKKIRSLIVPIVVIGMVGFYYLFINVGKMYVDEIGNIKESLYERPNDPNLILGRISGSFIFPKMIKKNIIFGIGTGNYPLLRNNISYRGFFPLPMSTVRIKDAHGFGGIVDILVDNGLFGLTIFIYILGVQFIKFKISKLRLFLIGFVSLFLFGVQIHFLYPWVLLGLLLVKENQQNEISN